MNKAEFVHVTKTQGELHKDVTCTLLVHPKLPVLLLQAVVEQVTARRKLCDDVNLASHGKLLNEIDDMFALRTEFHGVSLGNSVLLLKTRIFLDVNSLDGDLGVC